MVDFPNEDLDSRDIPSRDIPERYVGTKNFTRQENNQVYQKAVEESNRKDSEWMAKLAVLASGAHILGRLAGRNVFADMADIAGAGARFLGGLSKGKPSIEFADNLYRALNIPKDAGGATVRVSRGAARLDSYSKIQDLGDALGFLYDPKNAANRTELERLFRENFAELHRSGPKAKTPSFFHHDLDRLTFGELIDRQDEFVGHVKNAPAGKSLEIGIVQRALDLNLVQRGQIIDANLFKSNTGKIIDTRIMRPGNLVENVASVFNPFGLLSSMKGFIGSDRQFADLGPNKKSRSQEFFLNQKVYSIAGVKQINEIATGQTIGEINDARFVAASLREDPDLAKGVMDPNAGFLERMQDKFGVGRKFHEKHGGFFQTIAQTIRSARGVATGDAKLYARDYKYTHDSLVKRVIDPLIPEGETISEQVYHKGKYSKEGFIEPDRLTPTKGPFKGIRGFFNRIKAYAGANEDVALMKETSMQQGNLNKDDLYSDFGRAGLPSLERISGKSSEATNVTVAGKLDNIVRPRYYAASNDLVDKSYDFANWMSIRLNKLASASLAGIGFRPSGNLAANVARTAAIPASYYAGLESLKYTDYLIGEATGKKPSEAVADLYTGARLVQQELREKTGISQAAAYTEDFVLPGLSIGFVGTALSAVTFLGGIDKPSKLGATLAKSFMTYAAIGGPDVRQSAESLEREYSGEEKVPIKKSRWWTLGYQPFEGGEIDYFAPSWYAKLKQQPYTTSVYGSEQKYWEAGSALPTPSNLFGLSWLIDPYKIERENYYDRPYPTTAKMFEEVPIIGPLLADTIGEIIKPTKQMHITEQAYAVASSNITDKGVPTNSAKQLGIPELPASLIDLDSSASIQDRMEKWANVGLEPTGVWKYALGLFGIKFDSDYNMADAGNITSVGRAFYDLNLGGLFGECFIAGTMITTIDGKRAIETIQPGDILLSKDGQWKKAVKSHKMGIDNDLYKIHISTIDSDVIVTGTHRIPVLRRDNGQIDKLDTVDIDAKDIVPSDYVLVPIASSNLNYKQIDLSTFSNRHYSNQYIYNRAGDGFIKAYEAIEADPKITRKELRLIVSDADAKEALRSFRTRKAQRFNRYVIIDEEIGWLLGWYSAEGSIDKNGRLSFGLSIKEELIAKEIGQLIIDKFGATSYEIVYKKLKSQPTKGIELRVQCIPLALLCANLCQKRSENKIIPYDILYGKESVARKYLQSILNGDGWCNGIKSGFTSKNAELASGVFELALRFGAIGNCNLDYIEKPSGQYPQGTDRKETKRSYVSWGELATEIINIIYNNTDIDLPKSQTSGKSFICNKSLYVQVRSIEKLNIKAQVYDIEVEDLHYYVANQILVHNTELIRRFILSEYSLPSKINQQVNPIQNTMPRWLPGLESEFEGDRTYFTDFTRGDAFTKIAGGEFRLPGRGYESVNRLHSGVSGVYSDVDKFLVLSDIAPFSSSYFDAEKKVSEMELSPYWKFKVTQASEQRARQTDRFYEMNRTSQLMAAKGNELGITKTIKEYWLKGTQGILAEKPIVGSKLFPFQDPYRIYLKERIEGDTYADWNYPYESIIRPTIYDTIGQDPVTATTKALSLGALISSPMASFLNPFPIMKANPVATTVGFGAAGAIGATARMGYTNTLEHGFIPQHVQKEREAEEYFDNIEYLKYRTLEAKAEDMGKMRLANTYANKAKKTITYGKAQFEASGDDTRYKASLSRGERPFYEQFVNAPIEKRQKILSVVPEHMRQVLSSKYSGSMAPPVSVEGKANPRTQEEADSRTIEYFQSHSLPRNDWMGWHPSIPSAAIRIKSIQGGINGVSDNLHRFNYFPAQEKEVNNRFPDLEALPQDINTETAAGNALALKALFKVNDNPFRNFAQYTGNTNYGRGTNIHNATLRDHRKNDVFAFYTEVYR